MQAGQIQWSSKFKTTSSIIKSVYLSCTAWKKKMKIKKKNKKIKKIKKKRMWSIKSRRDLWFRFTKNESDWHSIKHAWKNQMNLIQQYSANTVLQHRALPKGYILCNQYKLINFLFYTLLKRSTNIYLSNRVSA